MKGAPARLCRHIGGRFIYRRVCGRCGSSIGLPLGPIFSLLLSQWKKYIFKCIYLLLIMILHAGFWLWPHIEFMPLDIYDLSLQKYRYLRLWSQISLYLCEYFICPIEWFVNVSKTLTFVFEVLVILLGNYSLIYVLIPWTILLQYHLKTTLCGCHLILWVQTGILKLVLN